MDSQQPGQEWPQPIPEDVLANGVGEWVAERVEGHGPPTVDIRHVPRPGLDEGHEENDDDQAGAIRVVEEVVDLIEQSHIAI